MENATEASSVAPWLFVSISVIEIAVAVLGNLVVLLAFYRDRLLRTPRFYILFNLAFCDLLHSLAVAPVAIVDFCSDGVPPAPFCPIIMLLAYVLQTESVLTVLCISADRYWLTRNPFGYIVGMSARKMRTVIVLSWSVSLCVAVFLVLLWPKIENMEFDWNEGPYCTTAYQSSKYAVLILSLEFGIPFFAIVLLNSLIYKSIVKESDVIRKISQEPSTTAANHQNAFNARRTKGRSFSQVFHASFVSTNESANSTPHSSNVLSDARTSPHTAYKQSQMVTAVSMHHAFGRRTRGSFREHSATVCKQRSWPLSVSESTKSTDTVASPLRRSSSENQSLAPSGRIQLQMYQVTKRRPTSPHLTSRTTGHRRTVRINKRRIAKALFLLVLVYLICWLPYSAGSIYNKVCNDCVSDTGIFALILISYLYPALNPFLYAIAHQRFARNFKNMYLDAMTRLRTIL